MGLTAGNLSANFSRIHPVEHACDRGYAIPYETVSHDEAKLAIGGTRDARAIFGDKFSKSREIKDFGRQEFLYDFPIFRVAHNIPSLQSCICRSNRFRPTRSLLLKNEHATNSFKYQCHTAGG